MIDNQYESPGRYVTYIIVLMKFTIASLLIINVAVAEPGKGSDYLDENSIVLITGGAGFIGSELAMAVSRTYNVREVLWIDYMATPCLGDHTKLARTGPEWREMLAQDPKLKQKSEEALSLFEFKRQRAFHVVQALGEKSHFIQADFRPYPPEYFDLAEIHLLNRIFDQKNVTHIVHLADMYHEGMKEDDMMAVPRVKDDTKSGMMVTLMEQMLKVKEERGKDALPHFVYASTHEVYDHYQEEGKNFDDIKPFKESDPITVPSSLRGGSKLIDEIIAKTYDDQHGIFSIGLRLFPVYGPWGSPGSPLFEMAERSVSDSSQSILLSRDEASGLSHNDVRDYIYIDDAIDAIMTAMQFRPDRQGVDGEPPSLVLNVGTGEGSTLETIAKTMEGYFPRSEDGKKVSSILMTRDDDGRPPSRSVASTERAEELLGFKARVPLNEGLLKLLAWHYDRALPYGDGNHESKKAAREVDLKATVVASGIESCAPYDQECLRGTAIFPCASDCSHPKKCTPSFYDDVIAITRKLTTLCTDVMYTVALSDDLQSIPSATMSVAPDGFPNVPQDTTNIENRCNIAFVSENSVLVNNIKVKRAIPQNVNISEEFINRLNHDVKNPEEYLLSHGFWTLVPVSPVLEDDDDYYVLSSLPMLSPGFFFSQKTQYAIYCDPKILFADVMGLLYTAQMQPKTEGKDGATAILISKSNPNKSTKTSQNVSFYKKNTFIERKALQQNTYNSIRIGLRGHLLGGGSKPLADTSWIVYSLHSVDSRLLRCDIYGEIIEWKVNENGTAMEFIMGLHDLWSKIILEWNNEKEWWTKSDAKNTIIAIPEKLSGRQPSTGLGSGKVIDSQAGDWMGVLSSTMTQSYVRIMPSSAVLAFSVDEYAYFT